MMNLQIDISVPKDTATPLLEFLRANLTPAHVIQEIGPRANTLVREHLFNNGENKKGWPSTHFWTRAAENTSWQAGSDFALISIDQIGVRQRVNGGPIAPVNARALTIPACPEAYGRHARDFSNLKFGFAFDPDYKMMRPALIEAQPASSSASRGNDSAQPAISPTAMFWLATAVKQNRDPKVLPSDADFVDTITDCITALLASAPETN
jgi:hypothetical protein